MMTETPTRNIALLIDADNASWHALDPVLTVLAELGTVNIRRVYGNWSKPGLKGWKDMAVKHGIEPQQQFDLTKGKNATDMKMTIEPTQIPAATGAKPPARGEVGPELLKLLLDAYKAARRDEKGYVSLSEMGQLAANRSSLNARNYAFNHLSDMIQTVPNFATERRADGR